MVTPLNNSRWFLLVIILLLVLLSFTAIQWGVADLRIRFARDNFDQWSELKMPLTEEGLERVQATLLKAQELTNEGHPGVKELLGKAALIRSGMAGAADREDITDALNHYQQAANLRPVSPYPWATIALIRHALGRYDATFEDALSKASDYGRWNPDILLMLAELDLSSNKLLLSPEASAKLDDNLSRALKVKGAKVIALAQKYSAVHSLCIRYGQNKKLTKLCA